MPATLPCGGPKRHIWWERGQFLLDVPVILVTDPDVVEPTVEEILPSGYQAGFHCPTVHGDVVPGQLVGTGGLLLKHVPVSNG